MTTLEELYEYDMIKGECLNLNKTGDILNSLSTYHEEFIQSKIDNELTNNKCTTAVPSIGLTRRSMRVDNDPYGLIKKSNEKTKPPFIKIDPSINSDIDSHYPNGPNLGYINFVPHKIKDSSLIVTLNEPCPIPLELLTMYYVYVYIHNKTIITINNEFIIKINRKKRPNVKFVYKEFSLKWEVDTNWHWFRDQTIPTYLRNLEQYYELLHKIIHS